MTSHSDEDLVKAINSRDPRFFSIVHKRYFRPMFVQCRKNLVPPEDSEEIVNDIFIHLYTASTKTKFLSPTAVSSYLFKAIKNKCINYAHRNRVVQKRRRRETEHPESDLLDILELRIRERIWDSNITKLRTMLDTPSYRSLEVLRLVYFEDMSWPDIATRMGVTEQTARNLKTKGLSILARSLKPEDYLLQSLLLIICILSAL